MPCASLLLTKVVGIAACRPYSAFVIGGTAACKFQSSLLPPLQPPPLDPYYLPHLCGLHCEPHPALLDR